MEFSSLSGHVCAGPDMLAELDSDWHGFLLSRMNTNPSFAFYPLQEASDEDAEDEEEEETQEPPAPAQHMSSGVRTRGLDMKGCRT